MDAKTKELGKYIKMDRGLPVVVAVLEAERDFSLVEVDCVTWFAGDELIAIEAVSAERHGIVTGHEVKSVHCAGRLLKVRGNVTVGLQWEPGDKLITATRLAKIEEDIDR